MNNERLMIICATILGVLFISVVGGCVVHESNRTLIESKVVYGTGGTKLSSETKYTTYPIKKYLNESK